MIDFVAQVLRFAAGRRQLLCTKRRVYMALAAGFGLAGLGLAVVLKHLIPLLLCVGLTIAAGWAASRVGTLEWGRVIRFARDAWHQLRDILAQKEEELDRLKGDPRKFTMEQLLACANEEEIGALERILGRRFKNTKQFTQLMRRKATHEFTYAIRRLRGREKDFSLEEYGRMLDLTGEVLDVERGKRKDYAYETALVKAAFAKMTQKIKSKDREKLEQELQKLAGNLIGGGNAALVLTSGSLVAANLGGFATYTMASSIIGGVSSLVGITLPFAFYTGFSTVLSTIIGPAGWTALGAWFAHRLASPDKKTVFLTVMSMAAIRARLIAEVKERRKLLRSEIAYYRQQLRELETLLQRIEAAPGPESLDALPTLTALPHDPRDSGG